MKKFKFTINRNIYDVEIGNIEDNNAQVTVNGSTFDVLIDRNIVQQKTPKLVRSSIGTTSEGAKAKTNAPDSSKISGIVKSPLPGTILELHVKAGDSITLGQKILTLEAMKMENAIYAAKEGVVQSVSCAKGDSVMEGDTLMTIGE
jgi:glutaconyl-CoA/methylmalonyl-CoA decarboxylase subunit gamma